MGGPRPGLTAQGRVLVGIAIGVILILAAIVVGWYDQYAVQRDYADRYAARHGHIPPLVEWFYTPDSDADVERLRRLHRNLFVLGAALAAAALIVILYVRATTPG
jgi:hypothetical protein